MNNIDMAKVEAFAGQVINDAAATMSGVMTNIGHKLGLYKAMAGSGWLSSRALAEKTATEERYVREWLNNQTAGGYVHYDSEHQAYQLPDEHIPVLADDNSPVFLVPALDVAASLWLDEDKLLDIFKTGEGIPWSHHHHKLFCGAEALFRPGYKTHLIPSWLNAMAGVTAALEKGAKVADVGCGHGASTIVMAQAFKNSVFIGYDNHGESIQTATDRASAAGVGHNLRFVQSDAKGYQEADFDLICFMDCLHDMGDPVGAARKARQSLKNTGKLMLVEPAAADNLSDNINPVSRLYYAASTAVCTPCSRSQEVGLALGAQAGQKKLSEVLHEAGFNNVRKVAATPFNIILEAS